MSVHYAQDGSSQLSRSLQYTIDHSDCRLRCHQLACLYSSVKLADSVKLESFLGWQVVTRCFTVFLVLFFYFFT
uniref:Uncharacterized protein n=1 Tax=Physcomitrium patens TaxID=3218 RepID=A0A2K1J315_PHYPA|nr:hypothetical protein PHYPA_021769 [Physcomitrium patens]